MIAKLFSQGTTMPLYLKIGITIAASIAISAALTPLVKRFAAKVGAIDLPDESRRIHLNPTPRLGGLAIFIAFCACVLLFADIDKQVRGILIGSIVIVAVGAVDDVKSLPAWFKFLVQIAAALIAVLHGVVIRTLSNPFSSGAEGVFNLGFLAIPLTVIWIVAITNSVNLIDGLDGLAVGVSAISSIVMLIISLMVSDTNAAVILAALIGACLGFLPYNFNPAKIFMGDAGALLLGFVLSTLSVLGLSKFYAAVSFAVPMLALAVPLFDTSFAFMRRLFKGQNPMSPDRSHIHHRLIDMGLTQVQAVTILYTISAFLGLAAVVLATSNDRRQIYILVLAVAAAAAIIARIYRGKKSK